MGRRKTIGMKGRSAAAILTPLVSGKAQPSVFLQFGTKASKLGASSTQPFNEGRPFRTLKGFDESTTRFCHTSDKSGAGPRGALHQAGPAGEWLRVRVPCTLPFASTLKVFVAGASPV